MTTYNNPKRDTLEKNNLISYVVNPDGTLRAAFINGTRNWSPPSYDDDDETGAVSGSRVIVTADGVDMVYTITSTQIPTSITNSFWSSRGGGTHSYTYAPGTKVYFVTMYDAQSSDATGWGDADDYYTENTDNSNEVYSVYTFTMGDSDVHITVSAGGG